MTAYDRQTVFMPAYAGIMNSAMADDDSIGWYDQKDCTPCSESEALRFIRDMDGESPAVRMLLQWEHMILDGRITEQFLKGEGGDEHSRLKIIAFTQIWTVRDVDACCHESYIDSTLRRIGLRADHMIPPRIQPDDMESSVHSIWHDFSPRQERMQPDGLKRGCRFFAFPSMLASYAIDNEPWAAGMSRVLERLHAWSSDLIRSGKADAGRVEEMTMKTLFQNLDGAFHDRMDGGGVSPASLAMSLMLGTCIRDSEVADMRKHWPEDFPAMGFPLIGSALQVETMFKLTLDDTTEEAMAMSLAMSREQHTMFAAITHPTFQSDPWRAFTAAVRVINRVFSESDGDAVQTWEKTEWIPVSPFRILEELRDRIPHAAIAMISYAHIGSDSAHHDDWIIGSVLAVDWSKVSVERLMFEAKRAFPSSRSTGGATDETLHDVRYMSETRAGREFLDALISAVKGSPPDAAALVGLERIIAGTCRRVDTSALPGVEGCEHPLLVDGTDLRAAAHMIVDDRIPMDFALQTLAEQSIAFTHRMQVGRWERMEQTGLRTRLVSLAGPHEERQGSGRSVHFHVGVYWDHGHDNDNR